VQVTLASLTSAYFRLYVPTGSDRTPRFYKCLLLKVMHVPEHVPYAMAGLPCFTVFNSEWQDAVIVNGEHD
jgi:hypothetical protein